MDDSFVRGEHAAAFSSGWHSVRHLIKRMGLVLWLLWTGTAVSAVHNAGVFASPSATDWAFSDRSYRMSLTVQA